MLAAVVNGAADRRLLETYSDERHHAWQQNVANAGKSTLIMTPGSTGTAPRATPCWRSPPNGASSAADRPSPEQRHPRPRVLPLPAQAPPGDVTGLLPGDPLEDRRVVWPTARRPRSTSCAAPGSASSASTSTRPGGRGRAPAVRAGRRTPREDVSLVLVGAQTGGTTRRRCPTRSRAGERLGARAGELYVVRPDGLLMARGRAGDLRGLAARVAGGGSSARRPRSPRTAPSTRTSRCPEARPVARRRGSRCRRASTRCPPTTGSSSWPASPCCSATGSTPPTSEAVSVAASVR